MRPLPCQRLATWSRDQQAAPPQPPGSSTRGWMDGWMDALRLFRCATPSAQGPLLLLCFLGLSLLSLLIPFPAHALEHALSGRIHSFFHASTYWLIVCACALLSPLFSPLPPFTLSFSLVAPWCRAPHSCLRIREVSLGSSLATCRTVRLGHLHTVNRLLHCMGPFCRLAPPG